MRTKAQREQEPPWQGLNLIWIEEDLDYPIHPGCCQAGTQCVWGLFCWLTLHSVLNRQAFLLLGMLSSRDWRLLLKKRSKRHISGWCFHTIACSSLLKWHVWHLYPAKGLRSPILGGTGKHSQEQSILKSWYHIKRTEDFVWDMHFRCLLFEYHRGVRLLWEAGICRESALYWKCYCLCNIGYLLIGTDFGWDIGDKGVNKSQSPLILLVLILVPCVPDIFYFQLSNHLFEELAMDVYDEVDRRETDAGDLTCGFI